MALSNTTLSIIMLVIWLSLLFAASFMAYTYYREIKVKAIIKDFNARLDRTKFNNAFFEEKIVPNIMKMHNPFTLRKPTIENYFSPFFIDTYLINNVNINNTPID